MSTDTVDFKDQVARVLTDASVPFERDVTLSAGGKSVTTSLAGLRAAADAVEGLAIGGAPDEPVEVPSRGDPDDPSVVDEFAGEDYLPSAHLATIAAALIARDGRVGGSLAEARLSRIAYRWRRQGGKLNGKITLGKCVRLTGAAKHLAAEGTEFLIWVAADHAEAVRLTEGQLEALLWHELRHVARSVKTGSAAIRPHDAELFAGEIVRYGAWRRDLRQAADAVRQAPLPFGVGESLL